MITNLTSKSKNFWKFTEGWHYWQRFFFLPPIVGFVVHVLTLFLTCILTNWYWYLWKFDLGFKFQVGFYAVVGFTLMNRHWLKIGTLWIASWSLLVLFKLITETPDWRGFIAWSIGPVALFAVMLLLGPMNDDSPKKSAANRRDRMRQRTVI